MKLSTTPQDVTIPAVFEKRDVAIGDVAFILDMFADKIYTNKVRAVIRELACNAHDSHVMAGTTDIPFYVHLPTMLEPWFSLRDYGTGMADDEIANKYSAIGVSDKRDSNQVIGCYGIGALSPYSMADSFIVKSYRDGTVSTYQCMRDDERNPVVIPLGSEPTDEANGLEVTLTINDRVDEFEKEASEVFSCWEGTLPKINNQLVIDKCQEIRDRFVFKGDNFALSPSWGSMHALMGNIAYKIPSAWDSFNVFGYIKFELGELEFDTARENLSVTDKNKEAVESRLAEVRNSLKEIAVEQIDAQPSVYEKAVFAAKLNKGNLGYYIGSDTLEEFSLPEPAEPVIYWQSKYRGSEKFHTKSVSANPKNEYYLRKDRMTTRIRSYLKDMGSGFTMYIFKDLAQAQECGIPVELLKDLDDLPKVARSSSSSTGNSAVCKTMKFTGMNGRQVSSYWKPEELELDGSEIVYVEVRRNQPVGMTYNGFTETNYQIVRTLDATSKYIDRFNLFGLKTAFLKTAKFRKGNFIHLNDYLKRELGKVAPKTFLDYNANELKDFHRINNKIDNDEVREIIELAESCDNKALADMCKKMGVEVEMAADLSVQDMMDAFSDKHKILSLIPDWSFNSNIEIVAEYLGATVK